MKIFVAYLLAFYVLALSCIPCQDEAVPLPNSSVKAYVAAGAAVANAEEAHQEMIDLCSPFCICACCASVTINPAIAALPENAVSQLIPPADFSYLQILYTGDRAGIWQPPQERV
ncbi:hypothetical protein SAMN05216327_11534 [Dyadobacter sp. SG02]|uniref:DUF6660 family protein n=1 Tax=Dyadobacter sp. SG02 TaxID=1855291 RepID=UPI0008B237A9|nr:DUF6660 family protein [Dyadobacter sp. SG02]SEJ65040.1 hypothetical protein SAMN05216327_11534 [Dyadobacter sp. SG02]